MLVILLNECLEVPQFSLKQVLTADLTFHKCILSYYYYLYYHCYYYYYCKNILFYYVLF